MHSTGSCIVWPRVRSDCAYRHTLVVDTNVQHNPLEPAPWCTSEQPVRCPDGALSVCTTDASHRSAFHRGGSKGTRRHRSPPLSVSLNRPASVDTETTTWRGKRGAEARTVYAHGCGSGGSERKGWMVG